MAGPKIPRALLNGTMAAIVGLASAWLASSLALAPMIGA
jgi:hypothetical protein